MVAMAADMDTPAEAMVIPAEAMVIPAAVMGLALAAAGRPRDIMMASTADAKTLRLTGRRIPTTPSISGTVIQRIAKGSPGGTGSAMASIVAGAAASEFLGHQHVLNRPGEGALARSSFVDSERLSVFG
jgi:hypothetical protein